MTHDPLCGYSHIPPQSLACATTSTLECVDTAHVYGTATVCLTCFEREVRADEREQAAQRVSATFWPTDGSWVSEETTFDSMGRAAVAAARGEAQ